MRRRIIPVLSLLLSLALAGCGGPKRLRVDHGWVRLAAVTGHPAAAYFTLHGGPADETLTAVTSPDAGHAAMHESRTERGMMTMLPLATVPVAAGATVAFAPGGRHVMLFDMAPAVRPGGSVRLVLSFADGTRLDASVPAIAAGQPGPGD